MANFRIRHSLFNESFFVFRRYYQENVKSSIVEGTSDGKKEFIYSNPSTDN